MVYYCEKYWLDTKIVAEQIPNLDKLFGTSILITGATGMICSAVAEILFYLNKEQAANIHVILAGRNKKRLQKRFYCLRRRFKGA